MSLPFLSETLDAIPEAARSFYEEADGKFKLKIEGLEDTAGLKSALQAERTRAKDFEKAAKRWSGLDFDEVQTILREREDAKLKTAKETGDFDTILNQHKSKWQLELDAVKAERDALAVAERAATVGNTLINALAKAGVTEEGLELLQDRLARRIKSETADGKRLHRVMAADGVTPLAGTASDGFATLDDLVGEARNTYPSLFKGTGAGGSGTPPNKAGGTGTATITRKTFETMSPAARAAHFKAGGKITD